MTDSTPEAVAPTPELSMSAPKQAITNEVSKPQKKAAASGPRKSSGPSRVVGRGATDEVSYSVFRAVVDGTSRTRKSLTFHHLQARLVELGYPEAGADLDGRYGALTRGAVEAWQKAEGHEVTGDLTREQFTAVFDGDRNVTVVA